MSLPTKPKNYCLQLLSTRRLPKYSCWSVGGHMGGYSTWTSAQFKSTSQYENHSQALSYEVEKAQQETSSALSPHSNLACAIAFKSKEPLCSSILVALRSQGIAWRERHRQRVGRSQAAWSLLTCAAPRPTLLRGQRGSQGSSCSTTMMFSLPLCCWK